MPRYCMKFDGMFIQTFLIIIIKKWHLYMQNRRAKARFIHIKLCHKFQMAVCFKRLIIPLIYKNIISDLSN